METLFKVIQNTTNSDLSCTLVILSVFMFIAPNSGWSAGGGKKKKEERNPSPC